MKAKRTKSAQRTLIASALAALVATPFVYGPAVASPHAADHAQAASQGAITDDEVVADKSGWDDPATAATAAHEGRMLLRQVKDVQTALQVGDLEGAKHALQAAEDFAESLKPMMPYEVVTDRVSDAEGKVLASGADVAVDQMLPIYDDVSTVTAYAPAQDKAKGKAKAQTGTEAMQAVGTDITATTVYLPVLYFEGQIELASKALDQSPPDHAAASQAIDDALASLSFSATDVHLLPGGNAKQTS